MTQKNQSVKNYKVVFIDWNGTISASKFWGHLQDPTHPNSHLFSKIESKLFGELKHLLKPWMKGQVTTEEVITQISNNTNLSYKLILNEFIESCKTMKFATDNLVEFVYQLQKLKVKVVIATDNMDSFTRWTVPALGLNNIFDDILNSYTLNAMKGDFDEAGKSLFFTDYLLKHKISPSESLLIDDSEDKENRISNIGIEYRKIKPIDGLEAELRSILTLLDSK